jgi:hypothetical protein
VTIRKITVKATQSCLSSEEGQQNLSLLLNEKRSQKEARMRLGDPAGLQEG